MKDRAAKTVRFCVLLWCEPSAALSVDDDAGIDLSRYVAKHVRQFYAERNGEPLTEPLMKKTEFGVVAMADVSG